MFNSRNRLLIAATSILAIAACDDSPTDPGFDGPNDAVVEGRVDETTPAPGTASSPQRAPGTSAETVSVVRISASGEYTELASAEVQADGSYRVESVPSGGTDAAVVAYVDGRAAGEVLIHGEIQSGATIRAAPITYETTMESRAYARLVAEGRAHTTSASEIALLLRAQGPELESTLSSEAEIGAIADASAEAGATMNTVFSDAGVSLDADARSTLLVDAAVELAADLLAGLSLGVAHDHYVDAALDAYTSAGADAESLIMATAGAASTFDAQAEGRTAIRGRLSTQPVTVNLRARERVAASYRTSAEAALATAVEASIEATRTAAEATTTASELKAELEARLQATVDAAADAAVEMLAANASLTVRAEVRAAAEAALDEATLSTRLQGAATASAAASAMADYQAAVRSAVQAMVDAAGSTSADVDVITELFIAACGGAYVR